MSAGQIIGYFILATAGGVYASLIFWSGWFFLGRLASRLEAKRQAQQAAPRPYWAQRP